jgi:HK97 family phage major capsid protein
MSLESKVARDNPLVQAITATILARKIDAHPARVAVERYGDTPATRALVATIGSEGGFLIPSQLSSEVFVDALRPLSVIRRHVPAANFVEMPNGNLSFGRADSAPASGWIGESVAQDESTELTFGTVSMMSRKGWTEQAISNSLLRYGAPDLESIVFRQLLKNFAATQDAAFIAGNGGLQPKGLVLSAASTTAATSSPTNAQIIANLQDLIAALETNNVKMVAPAFLMTPGIREFLAGLTASGSGNFLFPSLGHDGTLFGIPAEISNNVPSETIILVDAASLIIGTAFMELRLHTGAYHNASGTLVSAFDRDESVARLVSGVDIALTNANAAATLTGVTWAA